MIILPILVFIMGVVCAGVMIHFKTLSENFESMKSTNYMMLGVNDTLNQKVHELERLNDKINRDLKDIKDSMVGYEFALKTFEDYMKAKLEDKP